MLERAFASDHSARVLLLIQGAAFWPVWLWYIERMQDGSDEPWGILALITALTLLCSGKKLWSKRGKRYKGGSALVPTTGIVILGMVYAVSYESLPALVRAGLAVLSILLSLRLLGLPNSVFLGISGLLFLSLPIIASLQFYLGYPLRFLTSQIVAEILSSVDIPVQAQGTILSWRGELVSVDAPCSGIKMLWSGLYMSFSLSCILRLGLLKTWASYIFASLGVFTANALRTLLIFLVETRIASLPIDSHELIGLTLFAAVSVVLIAFQIYLWRRSLCAPSFPC